MLLDESTIEELVEFFRENEETRIDENELDAYVIWFAKEHDEFEDFDEALDYFMNEMWVTVIPELFE